MITIFGSRKPPTTLMRAKINLLAMTQLFIIFWSTFFGFGNANPTATDIQQHNGTVHSTQQVDDSTLWKDDGLTAPQKGG
jgi:hypothetical protein